MGRSYGDVGRGEPVQKHRLINYSCALRGRPLRLTAHFLKGRSGPAVPNVDGGIKVRRFWYAANIVADRHPSLAG